MKRVRVIYRAQRVGMYKELRLRRRRRRFSKGTKRCHVQLPN